MDHRTLWPVRPKPLSDELLSVWIARIAREGGQKLQRFCDCAFGNKHQLWNRDIDRLAPGWLLEELNTHTNVPIERIRGMTLHVYEGVLYPNKQISGQLKWILPLKMYHRLFSGYGLQFCPGCLQEGREPYFRKRWRVALCTFCPKHNCMLHDRCPECFSPVAFHRRELGRPMVLDPGEMCLCSTCAFDLRLASATSPLVIDDLSFDRMRKVHLELDPEYPGRNCYCRLETNAVLHQFCKVLVSNRPALHLRDFVATEMGIKVPRLEDRKRRPFEERSITERHTVIQMAFWLMNDMESRVRKAWQAGAVRYNHLVRDLEDPPPSYLRGVSHLNRSNCGAARRHLAILGHPAARKP